MAWLPTGERGTLRANLASATMLINFAEGTSMNLRRVALMVIAMSVLSGCGHFTQKNTKGTIPCNSTPPNQPGCY
jgi:hypothetical protein